MQRKILLAGAFALLSLSANAQTKLIDTGTKWDGEIAQLVRGNTLRRVNAKGETVSESASSTLHVTVTAKNAQAVAAYLEGCGYEADAITPDLLTAVVPVKFIPTLAGRDDVLFVNAPKQFHPTLTTARSDIKATSVHQGTLLETPFTGKGVVVGVIDQGFEYNHAAFQGRVKALWSGNKLTTTIPSAGGSSGTGNGHGTHVTNIAAGSKISGHNLYGVAYGADIVMAPSDFSSSLVLSQAKAIKKFAEAEGKPWVINMSFGGHSGPHDASTAYDQGLSALSGKGGILVGAMGNEAGQKIHAMAEFTEDGQTKYFYPKPGTDNTSNVVFLQVWGQTTDGKRHFTMKPVLVRRVGNTVTKEYPSETQLSRAGFSYTNAVNPYNGKQYVDIFGSSTQLTSVMGLPNTYVFMIEVTGEKGTTAHAWINEISYDQEFATMSGVDAAAGDDNYLCCEGGPSPAKSIGVASYNNTPTFKSYKDGRTYSYQSAIGAKGYISNFSSHGPQLGDSPKPTVAAPGGCIQSAFAKTISGFNTSSVEITDVVEIGGKKYYYGVMSGTSMASPMVTGVVALWLEANPSLTYEDVVDIITQTARRDAFIGSTKGWDAKAGYGKIDAYNGIKLALQKKETGIERLNTAAPFTFQKRLDGWRVLFNNNESYADISLYSANGQLVSHRRINGAVAGQEEVIDFGGLTPGVYVLRLGTTASSLTRKLVVK